MKYPMKEVYNVDFDSILLNVYVTALQRNVRFPFVIINMR